jgi:ribosomal protein L16 Arg81 hydroxylase
MIHHQDKDNQEMKMVLEILEDRAAPAPRSFDGFDSLIAPIGTDKFFDQYWERKPFFIKRASPGYFDALLSLDDMDHYLGTRTFHEADIRIVKQGKDKPFREYAKDGVADRHQMLQAYGDGSMLLFSHLNRHHLPLASAISQCEAELHLPFRSNVYLSPPDSQGFKLHWDTHDVMVLQIAGSKTWQIFNNPLELPHEEQGRELPAWLQKAEKIAEVTLEAGDVLFLPRGFIHGAAANSSNSLHISVGMRSPSLGDIALGEFKRATLAHPDMRKVALYQQYQCPDKLAEARRLIHEIIDQLDLEGALDEVHCSFIKSRQPPATGRLVALSGQAPLEHSSNLRVRRGALYELFEKTDKLNLAIDGRILVLPKGVAPAIRFMASQANFSPEQLPGLEHESRLILAQTLHREGLVELV